MSTRAVTRSYLAAFTLLSAASIFACGGGGGGGSGGTGGGKSCDDGFVLDDNGDCVEDTGGGGGTAGEAGTGGSSANGGSGEGGSAATGGSGGGAATGGKGGTAAGGSPGTGGMAMTGGMPGTGGMVQASTFPCKTNCKVLVVGDGLAAGTGSADNAGYRNVLKNTLGAQFTLAGAAGTPPHEGAAGRKAADLTALLPGYISTHKPDLIVLSIGSEDIKAGGAAGLETKVMALVSKAIELAPNAGITVTSVPAFTGANLNTLKTYNNALGKLVNAQSMMGKHVRFVGLSAVLCNFGCMGLLGNNYYSASPYPSALGYKELADVIAPASKALMGL